MHNFTKQNGQPSKAPFSGLKNSSCTWA